jgi:hypothetical protein
LAQSTVVQHDELLTRSLHSSVIVPDVVLVKKIKGNATATSHRDSNDEQTGSSSTAGHAASSTRAKPRISKAKERRRRRDQGKKNVELEQSAMRLGLLGDTAAAGANTTQFDDDDDDEDNAAEWEEELSALERDLADIDMGGDTGGVEVTEEVVDEDGGDVVKESETDAL